MQYTAYEYSSRRIFCGGDVPPEADKIQKLFVDIKTDFFNFLFLIADYAD